MLKPLVGLKQDFRAAMNGIASQRMREAGVSYHVIFGIELPRLREILAEYPQDRALAQQLWHEDVRESRLAAILLTPPAEFLPDVADIWAHELKTVEEAGLLAMTLVRGQRWASDYAFRWIASGEELPMLCGIYTLCHILREPDVKLMPDSEDELRDHISAIPAKASLPLRKAAQNLLALL